MKRKDGGTPAEELEQAVRRKALRLLAVRDRTRAELRQRLGREAPDDVVERVLGWLEQLGYVDDRRFVQQWVRGRRNGSGPRKLFFDLQQKGIDTQLIRDELAQWTDPEQTYQAAVNLVRARLGRRHWLRFEDTGLSSEDGRRSIQAGEAEHERLRRRMVALLVRRGFDLDVAERAVREVLAEEGLAGGPLVDRPPGRG